MDGVLVDFQSGIDKFSEETKRKYVGCLDEEKAKEKTLAPSHPRV